MSRPVGVERMRLRWRRGGEAVVRRLEMKEGFEVDGEEAC